MKKWVKYIWAAVLLFAALVPLTALAKDTGEIDLKNEGNKATLSLTVEDRIAQNMTSLRLQMYVDVKSGEIAPFEGDKSVKSEFVFSDGIKSQVKDWKTFKRNNEYVIDIIISGTESIFAENGGTAEAVPSVEAAAERVEKTVTIGTLSLLAAEGTGSFSAEVGMLTEESAGVPVVEYMEQKGLQSLQLHITNTNTEILTGEGTGPQETESESESESESEKQSESESEPQSESEPETQPDTSDSGDDAKPDEPEKKPEETRPFAKRKDPKLKLSCPLAGSSYVHFSWKEIEGADGYEIRRITENGKAKLIATVMADEGTEFEKLCGYNKKLKFRVRAFQLNDKGKKVYGKYGKTQKIKTPVKTIDQPSSVTASVERASKKITITWKNPANADGIRIFMRTGETGEFETIRTIDGTAVSTYTLTGKLGQNYTFRMVGYKYVDDKPALFSNYSNETSVTTTPAQVSGVVLSLNKDGKPKITWEKVVRADAYQVYRCKTLDGTYKRLTTIKKRSKVTYTDKTAKKGNTYYYKVRAYVDRLDGKKEFGYSSTPQAITVKKGKSK